MKKRGLALILSLVMILSAFPMTTFGAEGTGFTDMPNNWSTAALKRAIANGLLEGFDGKIRAGDSLTRAEMATVVNKAFKPVKKASLTKYKDIAQGDWYYEEMAKAVEMKTFVGSGDKLNPKQKITREEAFAVLSRAFNILEKDDTALDKFPDKNDISKWAKDEVSAIISSGYVVGSDGKINPKKNITRAEFAQIMDGLIKTYISKEGVYTKDLEGNVMINKSGVILKRITITGDLFIGDGVGDGNVTLEDVKVTGKIVLSGVGEDSIKIVGKTIAKVSAINATTISVTFEGVEEPVEFKVEELTHGDNEVTFEYNGQTFKEVLVNYVNPEVVALKEATSAVVKAEKSKSQADVDAAKILALGLPEGKASEDLIAKLVAVQVEIDKAKEAAAKLTSATSAVVKAEKSKLQADVDAAKGLVLALPEGKAKEDLKTRLEAVQVEIDKAKEAAAKLATAIIAAEKAIVALPTVEEVRIADKKVVVDAKVLVEIVKALDKEAVVEGEGNIAFLETKIAELEAAEKLASATSAVVKAEKSKLQADVDAAKALVSSLPKIEAKDGLGSRLVAVQVEIDKAKEAAEKLAAAIIAAEKAISELPSEITLKNKAQVEAVRNLVEKGLEVDKNAEIKGIDKLIAAESRISEIEASTPITDITIIGDDVIAEGGNIQLDVTITPSNSINKNILWSVENGTGSAEINETGLFKGISAGIVSVKALSQDGSGVLSTKEINIVIPVPVTITSYNGSDKDIEIPRFVKGSEINTGNYKGFKISETIGASEVGIVTSIGDGAFSYNLLTSITIPDSVISIGFDAFSNNKLTSVIIPDSVTDIGVMAFSNNELTSVIIPDSVTRIRRNLFLNNKLTSVIIPDNVTSIEGNAFANNELTSVIIPDGVNIIEGGTFANNKLTSVIIPDGVNIIEGDAFANNKLTSVIIPDGVTNIYWSAFARNELTSVIIPDSVTDIGVMAFANNELAIVIIPDSVTSIEAGAFSNNKLKSVIISNNVTRIEEYAFSNNRLTSVIIPDGVTIIGDGAFANNKLTSVIIPDGVTIIEERAFERNKLTSITIPDSVTSIGTFAFASNELTSVIIPDGVTIIGDGAFSYNLLTSITIPDSVTSIGTFAFTSNELTSVIIPDGVTIIGDGAFTHNLLTSITIPDNVKVGYDLLNYTNDEFRDVYYIEGAGTYTGTQYGDWTKQ